MLKITSLFFHVSPLQGYNPDRGNLEKKNTGQNPQHYYFIILNKALQHQSAIFHFSQEEYKDLEDLLEVSLLQPFVSEKNTKTHCFFIFVFLYTSFYLLFFM